MSVALQIRDETTSGDITREFKLEILSEKITVRELIRKRVFEEVDAYNRQAPGRFHGLIQPTESEQALNGLKIRKVKKVDPEKQYRKAIDAFGTLSLMVIVNDRQVESLDDEIIITPKTVVTFLKLVPLVGG